MNVRHVCHTYIHVCIYIYINEGEATRLAELGLIFSPYKLLVSPTGIADIRL